jgi:hypothetical protein
MEFHPGWEVAEFMQVELHDLTPQSATRDFITGLSLSFADDSSRQQQTSMLDGSTLCMTVLRHLDPVTRTELALEDDMTKRQSAHRSSIMPMAIRRLSELFEERWSYTYGLCIER